MSCIRYFILTRTGEPNEPASSAFTAFLVEGDTPGLTKGKKVQMEHLMVTLSGNDFLVYE